MLVSSPLGQVCPTMINAGDRGLPLLDVSPSSGNNLSAWDGSRAQGCVCFLSCPRAWRQPHPQCNLQGWTGSTWAQVSPIQAHGTGREPPIIPLLCSHPACTSAQLLAMNPAKTETGDSLGGATLGLVHLCPHWLASCWGTAVWKSLRSGPTARFTSIQFSHSPRDK